MQTSGIDDRHHPQKVEEILKVQRLSIQYSHPEIQNCPRLSDIKIHGKTSPLAQKPTPQIISKCGIPQVS